MQFADFASPLIGDVSDVGRDRFDATHAALIRRLRRRWFVYGDCPAHHIVASMAPGTIARLLSVSGGTLSLGVSGSMWGPHTSSATAARIARIVHRSNGIKVISLNGPCGMAFLSNALDSATAFEQYGRRSELYDTTLRIHPITMAFSPPLSRMDTATSLHIIGLEQCISSTRLQSTLKQAASSMSSLGQLWFDGLRIRSTSSVARRSMLSAECRDAPISMWQSLLELTKLTSLGVLYSALDPRCACGLSRAISSMRTLRSLTLVDQDGNGAVDLDFSKLECVESLDIVSDNVRGLSSMPKLASLTYASQTSRSGVPERFVAEALRCEQLTRLDVRLRERAWQWAAGLLNLSGLDELVLASPRDPARPNQASVGPGRYLPRVLCFGATVGASQGQGEDARKTTPSRSRPRSLHVGFGSISRMAREFYKGTDGSQSAEEVCEMLLRTGVREEVVFVPRQVTDVEQPVRVALADLRTFVRRRFYSIFD